MRLPGIQPGVGHLMVAVLILALVAALVALNVRTDRRIARLQSELLYLQTSQPDGPTTFQAGIGQSKVEAVGERSYCFSKDWWIHRAVTYFTMYSDNFCWAVRTLKTEAGAGRTPAMMAKLTDHVWTLAEWLKRPAVQLA